MKLSIYRVIIFFIFSLSIFTVTQAHALEEDHPAVSRYKDSTLENSGVIHYK
ncbi:hypothetical protein L2734_12760 [Parashewanella spongiae]|uniref:hypothetical protein n=1 Tax=Parashewanella spongiae TaxID=342950 RepID=UPI00140460C3|nr:hypothetical protein [Parashewanella spongiae]MCL1079020.1 hypothetical protein [Parashewanella spongiae]